MVNKLLLESWINAFCRYLKLVLLKKFNEIFPFESVLLNIEKLLSKHDAEERDERLAPSMVFLTECFTNLHCLRVLLTTWMFKGNYFRKSRKKSQSGENFKNENYSTKFKDFHTLHNCITEISSHRWKSARVKMLIG